MKWCKNDAPLCFHVICIKSFSSHEKAQAVDQLKSKAEPQGASVVDSPQVGGAEKQEEVLNLASDGNVCITSCWLFTLLLS